MAACGDEIEVAADAGLRRMDIAQVVGAIDDPEFPVPGGEVEYFFLVGQNDERRKTKLLVTGTLGGWFADRRSDRRCSAAEAQRSTADGQAEGI